MKNFTVDDKDWFSWEGILRIEDQCARQAEEEGLTGTDAFFRRKKLFSQCLDEKPTYKERHSKWLEKQRATQAGNRDPIVEALMAIRDGHNDPRRLASEVLKNLNTKVSKNL